MVQRPSVVDLADSPDLLCRNDYRSFRDPILQANLRQVRVHDLRHTTASVLLAPGVAARVVMEILGVK
jgi:integrase